MSSTRPAARARNSTIPTGDGPGGDHNSVVLGPRDRLIGQLYIEGDLRVVGTVEGELDVTGSVEIDGGGRVTGPVTARDRLVVGREGSLVGDVHVKRLVVQDGATFSGKVSMGQAAVAPPKPAEPAPEPAAVAEHEPAVAIEPAAAVEPAKAAPAAKVVPAAKAPQAVKPQPPKAKRR